MRLTVGTDKYPIPPFPGATGSTDVTLPFVIVTVAFPATVGLPPSNKTVGVDWYPCPGSSIS